MDLLNSDSGSLSTEGEEYEKEDALSVRTKSTDDDHDKEHMKKFHQAIS